MPIGTLWSGTRDPLWERCCAGAGSSPFKLFSKVSKYKQGLRSACRDWVLAEAEPWPPSSPVIPQPGDTRELKPSLTSLFDLQPQSASQISFSILLQREVPSNPHISTEITHTSSCILAPSIIHIFNTMSYRNSLLISSCGHLEYIEIKMQALR